MFVTEQIYSCLSPAIIQATLYKNTLQDKLVRTIHFEKQLHTSIVDFPASTFPTTAIRVSMTSSTEAGCWRMSIFPWQPSFPTSSASMPFVYKIWQSDRTSFAPAISLFKAISQSDFVRPIVSPLFSTPNSKIVSPWPSSIRISRRAASFPRFSVSLLSNKSFSFTADDLSSKSRPFKTSSSSCSSRGVAAVALAADGYRTVCWLST